MMAINTKQKSKLEKLVAKFLPLIDDLGMIACPECGQKTLAVDGVVMRSGLRIVCEGYDQEEEMGQCSFTMYSLLCQVDELPDSDPKPVKPKPSIEVEP